MTIVSKEVLLSKQAGFEISDAIKFFTPSPPTCLLILQYQTTYFGSTSHAKYPLPISMN
jgi:hypothetical protein